ncbi:MAG: glucosamine-6-phosphate deaminase [Chitinophagaceae bacterium]|nr:glucosamine-6-phosphate deaminase [Chitinophagaceae bacterium]
MQVYISNTYREMSAHAAGDMVGALKSIDQPLVCVASGDTPAGMYSELLKHIESKHTDISGWRFVGLDEWGGMNGDDEGSCRYHLDRQLFKPAGIAEEKICFFDGRGDADRECKRIEDFITAHGGIDVAILGLGMNGHVGMNEPGSSVDILSHKAALDPLTAQVGQKYFSKPVKLEYGLTLGIGSLMKAKKVFLLVNGPRKAEIVKKVIGGEITHAVPATLLRNHPALGIYLDKEAAQLLQ